MHLQIELQGMPVIPEEDGLGSPQESFTQEHTMEAVAHSPSAGSSSHRVQPALPSLPTPSDTSTTALSSNLQAKSDQKGVATNNTVPEEDDSKLD